MNEVFNMEVPSGNDAPPAEEYVLVLRTNNPDLTNWGGFQWPQSGPVEVATNGH